MADNRDERREQNEEPLVSVIMPAFHSEKTIAVAVESVLCQEIPFELLILDNSPDDATYDALAPYLSIPGVIYKKNPVNQGVAASRNLGISMAKGKYIAFLDSDDWWAPGKLKKQVSVLEESGCVLCSTAREFVNADGSKTGRVVPVTEDITYKVLLKHNCINCSSVLAKREVIAEFGMEHDDAHEDYILWLRILKKYGCAIGINKPLLYYRKSPTAKTGNKLKSALMHYQSLRYAGIGVIPSVFYFISYAINGVRKHGIRG
ncbi:MAG: glycosyltransferase family 2 protein [Lachnospiraceae bacterium]|nr:glycosyltransferase family 2 protein [Lachnospiraceae bacterium]